MLVLLELELELKLLELELLELKLDELELNELELDELELELELDELVNAATSNIVNGELVCPQPM